MSQPAEHSTSVIHIGGLAPVSLGDPCATLHFSGHMAQAQAFETPYAQKTPQSRPTPVIFTDHLREVGRDGNRAVYTATVATGHFFSDGVPLVREHVVASLTRATALAAGVQLGTGSADVILTSHFAASDLERTLSQRWCAVARLVDREWIGTGPYRCDSSSPPEARRFVRNAYSPTRPSIEELIFHAFPVDSDGCSTALVAAVAAGEVDFSTDLSREDASKLTGVRRLFPPGNSTAFLYCNMDKPHFADSRSRLAINLGIDRFSIAEACYNMPSAFVARGLLPHAFGDMRDRIFVDRDAARDALRKTSTPLPDVLKMLVPWGPRPYLPHPRRVQDLIVEQIAAVGRRVEIQPTSSAEDFYAQLCAGEYDLAICGWIAESSLASDFLEAILSSGSIPSVAGGSHIGNMARWKSADIDQALARYAKQPSEQNLAKLQALIGADAPVLPLIYGPTVIVHSWRVAGFDPYAMPRFADLTLADRS